MTNAIGQRGIVRPPVFPVLEQHAEDAAVLWNVRSMLVHFPHVELLRLRRFDERVAAHLDGLLLAGVDGARLVDMAFEDSGPQSMFVAMIVALLSRDTLRLDGLMAVARAVPDARPGVLSAFGWASATSLFDIVKRLLEADDPLRRLVGIAACAMHRVDPGAALPERLKGQDADVRARALRTVGELGRRDLLDAVRMQLQDEMPDCAFWAGRSSVLLGDRGRALENLTRLSSTAGRHRARAFRLAFQAMPVSAAHAHLQTLADDPTQARWLIQGAGIAGDPAYVPWLINHMAEDKIARPAGESFSVITGADLAWLDLERKPPEDFESGPNDNPNDENVEMDPDDGLPWPDQEKVAKWWAANSPRFRPVHRYFMGAPVTREHCIDVLKNGYQRQRILAAHYLCLLNPGTPLFNTSAPAWRQQRLLATMT